MNNNWRAQYQQEKKYTKFFAESWDKNISFAEHFGFFRL